MDSQELTQEYSQSIKRLKKESLDAGISEEDFRKLYFESLNTNTFRRDRNNYYRYICIIIVLIGTFLCSMYYHRAIYSYLICNVQDYIYPGLRLIRKISIPFLSLFPSLSELYQEPCLIQNPFFTVVDMDCWPCSSVNNVRQAHNPQPVRQQQSAPFMYETQQNRITIDNLRNLYIQNKDLFDSNAQNILVNNKFHLSPKDIFGGSLDEKNLYIWKFSNFNLARILRQMIPRPTVVPKFGQSTERFLIIDSSQSSFNVPDTECNYSFILSLSGSRIIQLKPAEECKHQCKPLKVELKETYLLWYNWWYWRPIVQSSNSNITFVAHVGSYC